MTSNGEREFTARLFRLKEIANRTFKEKDRDAYFEEKKELTRLGIHIIFYPEGRVCEANGIKKRSK